MSDEDKLNFLRKSTDKRNENLVKIKKVLNESHINSVEDIADFTKANSFILNNKTPKAEFSRSKYVLNKHLINKIYLMRKIK